MEIYSLIYTFNRSISVSSKKKAEVLSEQMDETFQAFSKSSSIGVIFNSQYFDKALHLTIHLNVIFDKIPEHQILSSVSLLFAFAQTQQLTFINQSIYHKE